MGSFLDNALAIAKEEAEYDRHAKQILSDKELLSRIVHDTIHECESMSLEEIQSGIGETKVGVVPVTPSKTGEAIIGSSTESKIPNEGDVFFDLVFPLSIKENTKGVKGKETQQTKTIIVNIEAQKKFNPGYNMLDRGVFYCSRLISSQLNTIFSNSHYESIQKVYSIWICFDCPASVSGNIYRQAFSLENLYGTKEWPWRCDLINEVVICLGEETDSTLLNLLTLIFSPQIPPHEKIETLHQKHGFTESQTREEVLSQMCNLGEGLVEKGRKEGLQEGRKEGALEKAKSIALSMLSKRWPFAAIQEVIPELSEKDLLELQQTLSQQT